MTMSDSGGDSDGDQGRRKRIRQACLNCRRKKVRCGGEKPVCTFCTRLSQTCIYVEDGRSQRQASSAHVGGQVLMNEDVLGAITERLTAEELQHTLKDKVSSMNDRFDRIENTLQSIIPLLTSMASTAHLRTPGSISSEPPPEPEASQTHALFPPTPTPNDTLPPLHTILFAADVYFRFCHNQPYSLFHEESFRKRLSNDHVPKHLVWALLASARKFSSLPDLNPRLAEDPLACAKMSWHALKLPWDGTKDDVEAVGIIQTILLLVGIEHTAGHCAAAYMKQGFALRIALHSRLNMDPDGDVSPVFCEERKRTFWSLSLQDKLMSLSRERSVVLRDEMCRLPLPCSETAFREGAVEDGPRLHQFVGNDVDEAAIEHCSPMALIIIMASALNRVSEYSLHEQRYSELGPPWSPSSPYTAISASLLQLEVHFGMSEPLSDALKRDHLTESNTDHHITSCFLYAKSLFHLAHCLLHHPFLLSQRLKCLRQKAPASFSRNALATCKHHAMSITALRGSTNSSVLMLPSLYAYCHMVAGTIHALSLNERDPVAREDAARHFGLALGFLRDLSRYWAHAALMAMRLERFRQKLEGQQFLVDSSREHAQESPFDEKALWQSVDYSLLSTPTRPGSPGMDANMMTAPDLDFSPSNLFNFPVPDLELLASLDMDTLQGSPGGGALQPFQAAGLPPDVFSMREQV